MKNEDKIHFHVRRWYHRILEPLVRLLGGFTREDVNQEIVNTLTRAHESHSRALDALLKAAGTSLEDLRFLAESNLTPLAERLAEAEDELAHAHAARQRAEDALQATRPWLLEDFEIDAQELLENARTDWTFGKLFAAEAVESPVADTLPTG